MISLERIEKLVNSAITETRKSNNGRLFVLAGIPTDKFDIRCEYLFSKKRGRLDEYFEKDERRKMLNDVVSQGNIGADYWCSLEDYLLLGATAIQDFFDTEFIKLPFLKHILPFELSLEGLSRSSITDEDDCATECITPLFLNDDVCQQLEGRIGQIYRIGEDLFFTAPNDIAWKEFPISSWFDQQHNETFDIEFTVTEDEGSWIIVCHEMWNNVSAGANVGIFISNEQLKNIYSGAVSYLEQFSENHIFLKSEEAKAQRAHSYDSLAVLKQYWNVSKFRNFLVYRNVRNLGNIKIESVSQNDVIDDIMTQIDCAKSNKPYRDIFVTAPTGSGKSVMFQIPSILLHEQGLLTLVISPLIALMNDQVYSLTDKGLSIAATINSSVSPSEKGNIVKRVQSGEISVLYLSPESLLSRSDIKSLIGNRSIGFLVVDEAHIVTTWGKAFRPDYWYLGNYIQRLRRESKFPIATFTATAIYKGPEDMYSETRDSLGMRDPITYFGYIPRKNIQISFEKSEKHIQAKTREYNEVKFSVLTSRLEEFKAHRKKVLVYFPFVSLINDFLVFISAHETELLHEDMVLYHGGLDQNEKKENFLKFKSNTCRMMLATKAFGMGVDIPDIDVVYHFAPTGNVCDYIQEIGRAARDEQRTGMAKFDYLMKDFTFVNRLYGISTIRKYQILNVMKKIYEIGRAQGFRRNLLISSDDFQLIFGNGGRLVDHENDNIDNKVKTALLIIEKDFLLKLGYSPIVARPRALFTYAYFKANGGRGHVELQSVFGRYQEDMGAFYKVNLKSFWEEKYPEYSFARLKYEVYSKPEKFGFSSKQNLIPIIIVDVKAKNGSVVQSQQRLIDTVLQFCDEWRQSGKYFKQMQLEEFLAANIQGLAGIKASLLAETILNFLDVWNQSISLNHGRFLTFREDLGYRVIGSGYNDVRSYFENLNLEGDQRICLESSEENKKSQSRMLAILGLFDAADLLSYTTQGGENPEIFVRINSYYHLQNVISNYGNYENIILNNVKERHENSVKFLEYIFSRITDQTDRFWDFIESYFLGGLPDYEQGIDQKLIHTELIPTEETKRKPHAYLIAKH